MKPETNQMHQIQEDIAADSQAQTHRSHHYISPSNLTPLQGSSTTRAFQKKRRFSHNKKTGVSPNTTPRPKRGPSHAGEWPGGVGLSGVVRPGVGPGPQQQLRHLRPNAPPTQQLPQSFGGVCVLSDLLDYRGGWSCQKKKT